MVFNLVNKHCLHLNPFLFLCHTSTKKSNLAPGKPLAMTSPTRHSADQRRPHFLRLRHTMIITAITTSTMIDMEATSTKTTTKGTSMTTARMVRADNPNCCCNNGGACSLRPCTRNLTYPRTATPHPRDVPCSGGQPSAWPCGGLLQGAACTNSYGCVWPQHWRLLCGWRSWRPRWSSLCGVQPEEEDLHQWGPVSPWSRRSKHNTVLFCVT